MIQIPHFETEARRARAFALALVFDSGSSQARDNWQTSASEMAQWIIGCSGPEKGQPKASKKRG